METEESHTFACECFYSPTSCILVILTFSSHFIPSMHHRVYKKEMSFGEDNGPFGKPSAPRPRLDVDIILLLVHFIICQRNERDTDRLICSINTVRGRTACFPPTRVEKRWNFNLFKSQKIRIGNSAFSLFWKILRNILFFFFPFPMKSFCGIVKYEVKNMKCEKQ